MYVERLDRVRARMREREIDALLLGPGPDMLSLSGYGGRASDQISALLLPPGGSPSLYIPELEAPGAAAAEADIRV